LSQVGDTICQRENGMSRIEMRLWLAQMYQVDAATLEIYRSWFRPDEHERFSGFLHERRRREFIVGRGLARRAIARELCCEPREIAFDVVEQGKLVIQQSCVSGPIYFNITHTADYVGCVTSRQCPVGVDVEKLDERVSVVDIAARFFSATESRRIQELAADARLDEFFTLWTLKEALAKAHGLGLAAPLESSQMRVEATGVFATSSDPAFSPGAWLACSSPTPRHRLALCALCAEQSVVSIVAQEPGNSGDIGASSFEWITGWLRTD
jgi:4'-phosphopantetheinyl transferase